MSKSPRLRKKKGKTSQYRNIHKVPGSNKYVAQITIDDKKYYLGIYDDEIEAAGNVDLFILMTGGAKPLNLMDFPEIATYISEIMTGLLQRNANNEEA